MLNARGSSKSCGYGQPGPSNQLLEHRRLPDDLSRPSDKSLSLQKPRGGNKIALQHLVAAVLVRLGMQRAGNCWRHREEGGGRREEEERFAAGVGPLRGTQVLQLYTGFGARHRRIKFNKSDDDS